MRRLLEICNLLGSRRVWTFPPASNNDSQPLVSGTRQSVITNFFHTPLRLRSVNNLLPAGAKRLARCNEIAGQRETTPRPFPFQPNKNTRHFARGKGQLGISKVMARYILNVLGEGCYPTRTCWTHQIFLLSFLLFSFSLPLLLVMPSWRKNNCPAYKRITGADFICDGFHYANSSLSTKYFLSHFHSDHYGTLSICFRALNYDALSHAG